MTARIHIDVGDVHAIDPSPTGVWDESLWDDTAARWAGTMPNWTEVSCRVREVNTDRGRPGVLDIFEAGRATIEVANDDGWATWSTTAPGPVTAGSWIRVRADNDPLFCGIVRRIVDTYSPGARPGATLVCVDPLARLAQVELTARAAVGAGDTAAERIGRVLDAVGWAAELRDLDPGGPLLTATDLEGNQADQAQRAAVTAGGHLWASCGGTIVYRDAGWLRTNPRSTTPQWRVTNTPTVPPVPPANLLAGSDGTFENGTVGTWIAAGGADPLIVAGPGRRGAYAMRLTRVGAGNAQALSSATAGQAGTPVAPGDVLSATAWLRRGTTAGTGRLDIQWLRANGTSISTDNGPTVALTTGQWVLATVTFTAPAEAFRARIRVGGYGITDGPVDVDDVYVVAGATPYTPPLTPPAPVYPPEMCATGMSVNGPDVERVRNEVTYAGVDAARPDDDPVEVTVVDGPSRRRYGPASWSVDGLFSTDRDQLTVLGRRVLALRAQPAPWVEALELSPIADPAAAELCAGVEFGDRLTVDYRDRLGWSWAFDVHVHGIRYRIRPSGDDNEVAEWTTTLTVDDASFWTPGVAWDFATWDDPDSVWSDAA